MKILPPDTVLQDTTTSFDVTSFIPYLLKRLAGWYPFPRHDPCILRVDGTDALAAPQYGIRVVIRFEYGVLGLRGQRNRGVLDVKFALLRFGRRGLDLALQYPLYTGTKRDWDCQCLALSTDVSPLRPPPPPRVNDSCTYKRFVT